MAGDEPLLSIPLVCEGEASFDLRAVRKLERVQACVDGAVAIDLDDATVDCSHRLTLEEVFEVVFLLLGGQTRFVGNGG